MPRGRACDYLPFVILWLRRWRTVDKNWRRQLPRTERCSHEFVNRRCLACHSHPNPCRGSPGRRRDRGATGCRVLLRRRIEKAAAGGIEPVVDKILGGPVTGGCREHAFCDRQADRDRSTGARSACDAAASRGQFRRGFRSARSRCGAIDGQSQPDGLRRPRDGTTRPAAKFRAASRPPPNRRRLRSARPRGPDDR